MPAGLEQHVDVQGYDAQAPGGQYEQQYDPHAAAQQQYEQQPPLDAQQYDPAQLQQLQEQQAAAAQQGQDPISALLAAGAAVGDPNSAEANVDIEAHVSQVCFALCSVSARSSSWGRHMAAIAAWSACTQVRLLSHCRALSPPTITNTCCMQGGDLQEDHRVKKCQQCQLEKPISDFNKEERNPDQLSNKCKGCRKAGMKQVCCKGCGDPRLLHR